MAERTFKEISRPVAWDFKENGPTFEGTLIAHESGIGPNKSELYTMRSDDGDVRSIWGSTALDPLMQQIGIGQYARITFNGDQPSTKRAGKTFKSFRVEVAE